MDAREEILRSKGIDPATRDGGEENEEEHSTPHLGAGGAAQAVDPFGPAAIMDDATRAALAGSRIGIAIPTEVAPVKAAASNKEFVERLLKNKPVEGAKNKLEDESRIVTEVEDEGEDTEGGEASGETTTNAVVTPQGEADTPPQASPNREPITFSIELYGQREPLIKFGGFWTGRDIRIAIKHVWRGYRFHKRDMLLKKAQR